MGDFKAIMGLVDDTCTEGTLQDLINNVSDCANQLKTDVRTRFEVKYLKFLPVINENDLLLSSANSLKEDINDLQLRLDTETKRDVANLIEELESLSTSLVESTTIVEDVTKLLKVDEDLKNGEKESISGNYFRAAQYFCNALRRLNEDCRDLDYLDIFSVISDTIADYQVKYCQQVLDDWKKSIQWTQIDQDVTNKNIITSLSIRNKNLESLLKTLELYDAAHKELAAFSDKFLKLILTPIIQTEVNISVQKNKSAMEDRLRCCSTPLSSPKFGDVVINLLIAFKFLNETLNLKLNNDTTLIQILSQYILNDFLDLFIYGPLTDAIPTKREDFKKYTSFVNSIKSLKSSLIEIGFLPTLSNVFDEYCGNVENLFLKKMTENYLDTARELMKKELHDVTLIGETHLEDPKDTMVSIHIDRLSTSSSRTNDEESVDFKDLKVNFFQFPRCAISNSTVELLELVKSVLVEGAQSDKKSSCIQMFNTARTIVFLYKDITPVIHTRPLRDAPQYAAILHNNLMYLAHRSLTLEHEMKSYFPQGGNLPTITCFADLVIPLRSVASEILSAQIMRQKNILIEVIKDSGFCSLRELESLTPRIQKSVNQCLRQLNLLKTVWEGILPSNIYVHIIGDMSGVVIEEIISKVVSTKDIRANVAVELAELLTAVQEEIPQLFQEPNEIYQHVRRWSAFKELIGMLTASLVNIDERWADGKGPLAVEFTPDQVRQMIQALFQMSDKRSAVLLKIK